MNLIILHFQPLEGYPPVLNFLNSAGKKKNINITCISTVDSNKQNFFNPEIKLKRFGKANRKKGCFGRILHYLHYNIFTSFFLLFNKADSILYYESISSWPAYFIHRIKRNIKIYIHYHEYTSLNEYSSGMKLVQYFHQCERKLYHKVEWISHTNDQRMDKFIADEQLSGLDPNILHILPNYPPKAWNRKEHTIKKYDFPLKLVYVGFSISFKTIYGKEIFDFVKRMNGKIQLDCYLHKIENESLTYLKVNNIHNVRIMESVNYYDLPEILKYYDIGLILYKGKSENYIYNAPNKLFEYLVCGLDVWFPEEMIGTYPYISEDTSPKILKVNFSDLKNFDLSSAIQRGNGCLDTSVYQSEYVYEILLEKMLLSEKENIK